MGILEWMRDHFKQVLELSALILAIINGLWLVKLNLRDKPKLKVEPIHPEVYQWWFKLPPGEYMGFSTRRYGFISYIDIVNHGLRKVSLASWTLYVDGGKTKQIELEPISAYPKNHLSSRYSSVF